MTSIHKPILQVFLKEEDNYCAKCCKTRQVIERMIDAVPEIRANIKLDYQYIAGDKVVNKFGVLTPPVVIINEEIFSEGHVPIIKKLSRELLELIK